jgi:Ycf66 protein N-terminus
VGFGTPLSLVIGLILISGGLVLFFLGNFRPDIKKDSDNIYAVLAIIAGILGVVSFNKEIVPSLEQLLLAGMGIFLMWENINNRTPNPDARRSFDNRRDDDRAGRRTPYRADRVSEYEEFNPPRGSAGLRGEYQDAGYGSNSYRGDRSLPRRDERDNDRGNDRTRRDRPNRSDRFDNYGNSQPEDRFGSSPRQLSDRPERNNRDEQFGRPSDRSGDRPSRDDAPRRRNPDERPPRRRPDRVEDVNAEVIDDIPAADYTDFTPVESTDRGNSGSSWGPQD